MMISQTSSSTSPSSSSAAAAAASSPTTSPQSQEGNQQLHPFLLGALGVGFLFNVGLLLSLPPVLMGRGAPYLPTKSQNMNAMFHQLRQCEAFQKMLKDSSAEGQGLVFCDLGSGDGRWVFRAAREKDLFQRAIGYEINPFLHVLAQFQRLLRGPHYWHSTNFILHDIWKANLRTVNVVAVYGLGPIMKDLGVKLQDELEPGSLVMSNVFRFPGWIPVSCSSQNTFLYIIPEKEKKEKCETK